MMVRWMHKSIPVPGGWRMEVEIWSDFACPFCYMGKRHFERALSQFEAGNDVHVTYRSFELDPNAPLHPRTSIHNLLAEKYGMSVDQAKALNDQVTQRAAAVGLTYHMDTMILTNSFDAHRLTHFAAEHGKMPEMAERLFQAYFTDSRHIGDRQTLAELAGDVGLSTAEALNALNSDEYSQAVRWDEQQAKQLGVRGVPFFLINQQYAVSGAQPVEVFLEALQKAAGDERAGSVEDGSGSKKTESSACDDETCDVPS